MVKTRILMVDDGIAKESAQPPKPLLVEYARNVGPPLRGSNLPVTTIR